MTLKLNLSHLFVGITNDANSATTLFDKTNVYVQVAEQIGKAWGLTGAQKLESVKAMLVADLNQASPALAATVVKAWTEMSAVVSVMIAIFNTIGWAFEAAAPIIVVASPGTATAIAAITAAITTAQNIGKAVQAS